MTESVNPQTVDPQTVDLSPLPPSQVQTAVYYEVRDLARGQARAFIFSVEPAMLLDSVNLQMRGRLRWEITALPPDRWRAMVRRVEDVPVADVMDALRRDHQRLDELFSRALHLSDAGRVAEAEPVVRAFVAALERHLGVESELLARAIRVPPDASGQDPTAVMLAQHDQILREARAIAATFTEGVTEAAEVSPLFAILAGTLAKHEVREEASLFPHWGAALRGAPAAVQADLLRRVSAALADPAAATGASPP